MDKITQKFRDEQWQAAKARQETVGLAKLSQQLISGQELRELWLTMKPGEVLVLGSDGSLHKGSRSLVKMDKMTKLKEEYRTERHSDLLSVQSDLKSAEELYPMPMGGKKSTWDTQTRLAGTSPRRGGERKASKPVVIEIADNI
jgi:hypothetical protein